MEPLTLNVCRSCRLRLIPNSTSRAFGTSSIRCSIPAESPQYIDIPPSFQPEQPYKPRVKGFIPAPRELFPNNRPDKPSKQYIENVTRDPMQHNIIPEDQLSENQRYKVRMAELRKSQLREGLKELHIRKRAAVSAKQKRSLENKMERERLIAQPEREDARLTDISVPTAMMPDKQKTLIASQADLEAAKRIYARKMANHEKTQATKHDERMDKLHTLYMNARSFITTEDQLNQALEEAFDTDVESDPTRRKPMHADFQSSVKRGESMWNFGPPDSIKDMIADATNRPRTSDQLKLISGFGAASALARQYKNQDTMSEARFRKDQDRLKKIAEKLSGGKI